MTSPPPDRTSLITLATWVSDETGPVPSQDGAQEPPPARMNAMSNAFCPVVGVRPVGAGKRGGSGGLGPGKEVLDDLRYAVIVVTRDHMVDGGQYVGVCVR